MGIQPKFAQNQSEEDNTNMKNGRKCAGLVIAAGLGGVAAWAQLGDGRLRTNPKEAITTPTIGIGLSGTQAAITFMGTLQAANNVAGPWTNLPNAVSPLAEEASRQYRFYRTLEPVGIFSTNSVVTFTVTGPLQKHFELAFAGSPDGIFPPKRVKPYFEGTVTVGNHEIPVNLRVRGNSSLQECPFPKLKFKVAKETRVGTPFADAREVKIGTHCGEGGRGNIGRLRDESAAYREALAYETMDLLGFVTPRLRRARIVYQDNTSPTNSSSAVGWSLTRSAFILDDVEVVAERMGGRALSDEEIAALGDPKFDGQLVVDLQFLHALLGNWDYGLGAGDQGLQNTDVITLSSGELIPVAGDFDLASWVTEVVRLSAPREYLPELPDIDRQARYEMEQIRSRVSESQFGAASNRFVTQRTAMESRINAAVVDEPGRTNALRHVTAFFDALTAATR